MRGDTILFLVVEQSSNIELIYSYKNRDHQTDIIGRVAERVVGGSKPTRQRNYITLYILNCYF